MIDDLAEIFYISCEGKKVKLSTYVDSKVPQIVKIDEQRIQQVLMNLISNALKFTTNGTIQISLNYDLYKNILKVNVKDTGPGIKKED